MSISDFADRFDSLAHATFVRQRLGAFDDAIVRTQKGEVRTPVRCQLNRRMEQAGEISSVPQDVTQVRVFRADAGDLYRHDQITVDGTTYRIDSPRLDRSGALDTYDVVPEA